MAEAPNLVHVEIFGQTYAVRAGADPSYVEQLGRYVDEQMQQISRSSGAVDSVRIAVLAALNIADEYFRLKSGGTAGDTDIKQRAKELADTLEQALSGPQ
jgi:cell division protein ZapA